MFLIQKAIGKIKINIVVYCIIFLEVTLGVAFLSFALNMLFSYQDKKGILEQEFSEQTTSIEITQRNGDSAELSNVAFDYSDYKQISRWTDKVDVYMCVPELLDVNSDMEEVPFVYSNAVKNPDSVFCGANVVRRLKGGAQILDEDGGKYTDSELIYHGRKYECVQMPEALKRKTISRNIFEEGLEAADCVFLPLQDISGSITIGTAQTMVSYQAGDSKQAEEVNQKIIQYLAERHPEYEYKLYNYVDNYEQNSNNVVEYAKYIAVMALIAMWILSFGYFGITKQFLKKREREIAICLSIGATKGKVFLEICMENIFVLLLGVTAGNIGGNYLLRMQPTDIFISSVHWKTVLCTAFLIGLLFAAVHVSIIKRINKLQPQKILSSQ